MRLARVSKLATRALGLCGALALAAPAHAQDAGDGTSIVVTVDGVASGVATSFRAPDHETPDPADRKKMMGAPKIGEATAVFDVSLAGALLPWLEGPSTGGTAAREISVRLADQDYNIKRGVDLSSSVITGIEFPELKASDGKKHFEVTAKWQPQNLKYVGGGGKAQGALGQKAKSWVFGVDMPRVKTEYITSIGLPKLTPKLAKESHGKLASPPTYDAPTLGTLTVALSADGVGEAAAFAERVLADGVVDASERLDVAVVLYDADTGARGGTFALTGCALKKFNWAPKLEGGKEGLATATMEFLVEDFRFKIDHK